MESISICVNKIQHHANFRNGLIESNGTSFLAMNGKNYVELNTNLNKIKNKMKIFAKIKKILGFMYQ